eukprot:m.299503 g.299503  ORF g.299503 m.299503 type:complete len:487 (-) comp14149_c0_seq1:184-1644(-)
MSADAAVRTSTAARAASMGRLPLLDEQLVLARCAERGIKPQHAYTMWRDLIKKGTSNVRDIPNLPHALYDLVEEEFTLTTSKVKSRSDSADGSTTKLCIELFDGQLIETVVMRYGRVQLANFPKDELKVSDETGEIEFKSKGRATVCISSQVGCLMGCTFCATGTMGLLANLTAGEILEQVFHANQIEKVRNVVFMGMGEPLDNYDAVISTVNALVDVRRFSLSPRQVSISTVGVVPRLRSLAADAPGISLALSLHAPTQELRAQIVPSSKAWHIDRIIEAMDEYVDAQNNRRESGAEKTTVLIEYVLIADVNDSQDTAHELGQLLQGRPCTINVIPYNPTEVPFDYKSPTREVCNDFVATVREYGHRVILRQELGQDIASACGQLVITTNKQSQCGSGAPAADIEDLLGGSSSAGSASQVRRRPRRKPSVPVLPKKAPEQTLSESFVSRHRLVLFAIIAVLLVQIVRHAFRLYHVASSASIASDD